MAPNIFQSRFYFRGVDVVYWCTVLKHLVRSLTPHLTLCGCASCKFSVIYGNEVKSRKLQEIYGMHVHIR